MFCWHCSVSSNAISSKCKDRLSSEVMYVVQRPKWSKCCGVLTLLIIFLSINWDILPQCSLHQNLCLQFCWYFLQLLSCESTICAWLFSTLCMADNTWPWKGARFSPSFFIWFDAWFNKVIENFPKATRISFTQLPLLLRLIEFSRDLRCLKYIAL